MDKSPENKPQKQDKKDLTAFERWELPAFGHAKGESKDVWKVPGKHIEIEEGPKPPTAEELESIRKAAYEEGFEQGKREGEEKGYQQGLKKGETEVDATIARLTQISHQLLEPIQSQEKELEDLFLKMVETLCRHILRRELKADSSQILALVKEAIGAIETGKKKLKIYLNEQDYSIVEPAIKLLPDYSELWKIEVHPKLSPGGCVIESEHSSVDATVDTRFASLLKQMYDREMPIIDEADEVTRDIPDSDFFSVADESPTDFTEATKGNFSDDIDDGDHHG